MLDASDALGLDTLLSGGRALLLLPVFLLGRSRGESQRAGGQSSSTNGLR